VQPFKLDGDDEVQSVATHSGCNGTPDSRELSASQEDIAKFFRQHLGSGASDGPSAERGSKSSDETLSHYFARGVDPVNTVRL